MDAIIPTDVSGRMENVIRRNAELPVVLHGCKTHYCGMGWSEIIPSRNSQTPILPKSGHSEADCRNTDAADETVAAEDATITIVCDSAFDVAVKIVVPAH